MEANNLSSMEISELLHARGKHTQYQTFPIDLSRIGEGLDELRGSVGEDAERYRWIKNQIGDFRGDVIDIGANLGYFSLRLAQEHEITATLYEPFEQHAKVIPIIRDAMGINSDKLVVRQKGVSLDDLDGLPKSDLTIFLNVLHHAGEDFDSDKVLKLDDWKPYAVSYLNKLRNRTGAMFFQLGYTWLGHAQKLCKDSEIIDFTGKLLGEAGWTIKAVGLVKSYENPISYSSYEYKPQGGNRVFLGGDNENLLNKIAIRFRKKNNDVGMSYRFAQRPLWYCIS